MPAKAVLDQLHSSATEGLSTAVASERLREHGRNVLKLTPTYSALRTLLSQFRDPQMLLLFSAAALSFAVWILQRRRGWPVEALFIAAVGGINALLGFVQEHRAQKAMQALRKMTPARASVLRDAHVSDLLAEEVVPGDILVLHEGAILPADARLIQSSSLLVDEALLTGESGAIPKNPDEVPLDTNVADRSCMVFSGSAVLAGSGRAVVTSTGDSTALGEIANLVSATDEVATPLQRKMAALSKALAVAVVLLSFGFTIIFYFATTPHTLSGTVGILLFSISLAVAASPEALATIVTLTLALATRRLTGRGAIVRKMAAVETLGASTVILCDKTGTVTLNRLAVEDAISAAEILHRVQPQGHDCTPLIEAAAIASIEEEGPVNAGPMGGRDAVDLAIWSFVRARSAKLISRLSQYEVRYRLPFTSERKLASVVAVTAAAGSSPRAFVKGAPEVVLDACVRIGSGEDSFEPTARQQVKESAGSYASRGFKVLAVAVRDLSSDSSSPVQPAEVESGLTFLGFLILADPVREEAKETIAEAARAGLRTVLITGDHPRAASEVAKRIGIPLAEHTLSGREMDASTDEELSETIRSCNVLARVTPAHKLRVARILQSQGEIVTMTGDGVNDAPALKQADVGIALGSGTELAKQSADVVLTDDNIATIVHAIKEGRGVLANVRTATAYLLASNLSEILTLCAITLAELVIGTREAGILRLPLTTEQILWMNLITDTIPALTLSFTITQDRVPHGRAPVRSLRLFQSGEVLRFVTYACFITVAALLVRFGLPEASEQSLQTVTVTTLVFAQALYALALGPGKLTTLWRDGWRLILAVGFVLLLQSIVPCTGFGQRILGMEALSRHLWAFCFFSALVAIALARSADVTFTRSFVSGQGSTARFARDTG